MTHLVLSLVIAAGIALDDEPAFQQAQQLYRELEFERATIRFQESALAPDRSPQDRARLFVWIAICYAQLTDEDAARRALADAVKQDPSVELPSDAPPKLGPMLDEARAMHASAPAPKIEEVQRTHVPGPQGEKIDVAAPEVKAPLNVPAWVTAGVGGVGLLTAGVFGVLALSNVGLASDPSTTQVVVVESRDAANLQLWVSGISAGVGAALTTTGVGLLALE